MPHRNLELTIGEYWSSSRGARTVIVSLSGSDVSDGALASSAQKTSSMLGVKLADIRYDISIDLLDRMVTLGFPIGAAQSFETPYGMRSLLIDEESLDGDDWNRASEINSRGLNPIAVAAWWIGANIGNFSWTEVPVDGDLLRIVNSETFGCEIMDFL